MSQGTGTKTIKDLEFGILFFASGEDSMLGDKYRFLLESAKFADTHGFSSVWVPELHSTAAFWSQTSRIAPICWHRRSRHVCILPSRPMTTSASPRLKTSSGRHSLPRTIELQNLRGSLRRPSAYPMLQTRSD